MSRANEPAAPVMPPVDGTGVQACGYPYPSTGMIIREAFAMAAMQWEPPTDDVEFQERYDRNRNPYNEPHKPRLRDRHEIVASLQLRRADAMLQAPKDTP